MHHTPYISNNNDILKQLNYKLYNYFCTLDFLEFYLSPKSFKTCVCYPFWSIGSKPHFEPLYMRTCIMFSHASHHSLNLLKFINMYRKQVITCTCEKFC